MKNDRIEEGEVTVKLPPRKKFEEPEVCPLCKGVGVIEGDLLDEPCGECEGEGVCWKY